jgi:hypothetical protein
MRLDESPEAKSWLGQFDIVDREIARQLLRKLTLVSQNDFERNLQIAVEGVIDQTRTENVALLSITEPPNRYVTEGGRRTAGSSADRIKHLVENLSRIHGDRVRANPTLSSMRADRVKNIVLVEDFVGSGRRIRCFWKHEISKSVKSWASYKWTKIWLVCYAGLKNGLQAVIRNLPIPEDRIITVLSAQDKRLLLTPAMRVFAEKYGRKLRNEAWAGYSGGGSTLVFQHGCPNNTPAILWANSKGFRALFPNRGIPTGLQAYFGLLDSFATAEILWTFRQYKLALSLVEGTNLRKASASELRLVVALGLASTHGFWDDNKLSAQLMLAVSEVEALRHRAYSLGTLNKQDHCLTAFATDLLSRLKGQNRRVPRAARHPLASVEELYYPRSCGGVANR